MKSKIKKLSSYVDLTLDFYAKKTMFSHILKTIHKNGKASALPFLYIDKSIQTKHNMIVD